MTTPKHPGRSDGTVRGTVYLLPVCHLDTQWTWTVRDTIERFLPATLTENFEKFERFPNHRINLDGAFRYDLVREYDPEGWEGLRRWVAAGRFLVAGATLDAMDVLVPSPEALTRQILYGRRFFRRELGKDPRDIFLPDCFGFTTSLVTVAAHAGVIGFLTQKLQRHGVMRSAFGIPFPFGRWIGPDGSEILAVIDPGEYGERLTSRVDADPGRIEAVEAQRRATGLPIEVRLYGVGDTGGSPDDGTLEQLEASVAGDGPLDVVPVGSNELFDRLDEVRDRLPSYDGELLLSTHGPGCYTSQAAMKRWNRTNELLAEAAEKAAVAADWLGGLPYPAESIRQAWERFLWHQFHDDLTGTSLPAAYEISINDQAIAANQLAEVLRHAVGAVARALDTDVAGTPVVVFNPLSVTRADVVEVELPELRASTPVRVVGPDGRDLPAQVGQSADGRPVVVFVAELPPVGFAVFDVRPGESSEVADGPRAFAGGLENERYRVTLDEGGDLAELFDERLGRNLLAAPARLELLRDRSTKFPAWEVLWRDVTAPPKAVVAGPAQVDVLEFGPARAVVQVRRRHGRSTFVQRYRLAAAGAGDRLEIEHEIDWRTRGRLLKAAFPLAAETPEATFDLGVGTVCRGVATERLYEVPAQQWVDQTVPDGSWGAAVLADGKYGWDRPDVRRLRLSLVRTPSVGRRFRFQGWQDLGRHRFVVGLTGHRGDWREGRVPWAAARMGQRPVAFAVSASAGRLGREWSFLRSDSEAVLVRAIKRAEEGEETVIRWHELYGSEGSAQIEAATPIRSVRRVDGTEDHRGDAVERDGRLEVPYTPYRPESLACTLEGPRATLEPPRSKPLRLTHDHRVVRRQGESGSGGLGRWSASIPAELWPAEIVSAGIRFETGAAEGSQAVVCRGQRIELPTCEPDELVYLLAASQGEPRDVRFGLGGEEYAVVVPSATDEIATGDRVDRSGWRRFGAWRVEPGAVCTTPIAWFATHLHGPDGRDLAYRFAYLFRFVLTPEAGVTALSVPDDPSVLLFAVTIARNPNEAARPGHRLQP